MKTPRSEHKRLERELNALDSDMPRDVKLMMLKVKLLNEETELLEKVLEVSDDRQTD